MTCPDCGSGAFVEGVCSVCGSRPGSRRPKPLRRSHNRKIGRCKHKRWSKATITTVGGNVRVEWSRCLDCGEPRQVEVA